MCLLSALFAMERGLSCSDTLCELTLPVPGSRCPLGPRLPIRTGWPPRKRLLSPPELLHPSQQICSQRQALFFFFFLF